MNIDKIEWIAIIIILVCSIGLVVFGIGVRAGRLIAEKNYQNEAIDRGYAIYNPTNGNWQWK